MPTFPAFTTSGWNKVQQLKVGQFVAMHLWEEWDREKKVEVVWRAIFIGDRPWGKRNARKGFALEGEEVLRSNDMRDNNVECLMAELLSNAIHFPGQDQRVIDYSGDQALTLKDQGFRPEQVPIYCPKCPVAYEPDTMMGNFPKSTMVAWGVRQIARQGRTPEHRSNPKKVAYNPCVRCYESYLSEIDSWIERTDKQNLSVVELVTDRVLPPNAIRSESFLGIRGRVVEEINSIKNGR